MLANDEIRATSDELGTTLHAQAQRIDDCSRNAHESCGLGHPCLTTVHRVMVNERIVLPLSKTCSQCLLNFRLQVALPSYLLKRRR